MKVLKFGGSSVGTSESTQKVVEIILKSAKKSPIIVVISAFETITNNLILASEQAKNGNERYKITLDEIKYIHLDRIEAFNATANNSDVIDFIETQMAKVSDLCQGIYLTRSIPSRTKAEISSTGEILSSYIIAKAIDVPYKDTRELIVTTGNSNNATVLFKETNSNIFNYFTLNKEQITIVGGFIARNIEKETTTLGRGGSDYTASIISAALRTKCLEIWTDVSGMFTANPKIVTTAMPIQQISYQEAMELSHFGAKVLYPPTIIPVLEKEIPIHIKNTFDPESVGTIISNEVFDKKSPVVGISHIEDIALITLEGSGMIGIPGFSKRLFESLFYEKINVKFITQASSEHSICIAIDIKDRHKVHQIVNKVFEYEIITKKVLPLKVEVDLAIIALVGDQMKSHQGISGKLFSTLGHNNVNVRAIAQGATEKNISIIINKNDVKKALNSVHASFFENQVRQLNLFIIGVGNVGNKLLEQINQQKKYLLEHLHIELNIIALANSKTMIFNENSINLDDWQSILSVGEPTDFKQFFDNAKALNLRNSIFVDNTDNNDITKYYPNYLKESISIVTCNKIACSSEYQSYKNLKDLSKKYQAPFLFETNVGAGLPIIDTLKNLVASGDQINEIHAVLSGSLNYIFNNFELDNDEKSFYNVVKQAEIEGYTEPDPRIDLGGIDVGRKILILAREAGLDLEIRDVKNNSFLPVLSEKEETVSGFMNTLQSESNHFNSLLKSAIDNNCKLKYVASLKNGNASIGLQEIPKGHPFYDLDGSDNIVLFYTNRYSKQPLLIKGAGAGADVTASGIFADIIRIGNS
jgi:aspartokinase/homoserine dehydrogenase 1